MATSAVSRTAVQEEHLVVGSDDVHLVHGGVGEPLLFLHGAVGAGMWLPIHDLLAARFHVVAPTHPRFGASGDHPDIEDIVDLALHYDDLIAQLELDRPYVVGTSFGGWIAAELAAYRPEAISRLTLIDAIGLYLPEAPIADTFAMSPPDKFATVFHDPAPFMDMGPDPSDVEGVLAAVRDESAFAHYAWEPFCHDPRLARLLPRVTAPTLVVWGEDDRLVSIEHGKRFVELIPDARLHVIPECGHAAILERPELVGEAVVTFADEKDRR